MVYHQQALQLRLHSGGTVQGNTDSTNVSSGAYRVWMSVTASGTGGTESFNVNGNTAGC